MADKILRSDEMRFRVIDMEYDNLSEEEFIERLETIYIEEYGEKLPAEVEIFHSSQSKNLKEDNSGYDGTIIYLNSEENDISEMYVISQGSQDIDDWDYNIKAMFAGRDSQQAEAVNLFIKEAKERFNINEEDSNSIDEEKSTSIIGLSHSLGHNNNTLAHLQYDIFDEIYSINGAQLNYYQLYYSDPNFQRKVNDHFSISANPEAIYTLDPTELQAFAENQYAAKAVNIHQTISYDDPLYAVSGTRGFFTLGEVDYIDTNPDYPGLREMMDDIPDDVIRDFQELAIQYTASSNNGGLDTAINDIIGLDMDIVNQIQSGDVLKMYVFDQSDWDTMIRDMNDKVPEVLSKIKNVTSNADLIFGRLMEAGYITGSQKNVLVSEITKIEEELEGIQTALENNVSIRDIESSTSSMQFGINPASMFSMQLGGDVGSIIKAAIHGLAIKNSLETLNQDEFLNMIQMIINSHKIPETLESMSIGNKSYIGTDMILTATSGATEIRVNMSAALEMYQKGLVVLEEKETEIVGLDKAVEQEMHEAYQEERRKVIQKINDMEASPTSYGHLLSNHGIFLQLFNKVKKIQVNEVILPLEQAGLDTEIDTLHKTVEKGKLQIEGYRNAVESLFEEDERISKRFDLIRSV